MSKMQVSISHVSGWLLASRPPAIAGGTDLPRTHSRANFYRLAASLAAVLLIGFNADALSGSRRLREKTPTVTLSTRALLKRTVNCRDPVYPAGRAIRVRSVVKVEVSIDEGGAVRNAKVVSGHPFLRAEAVRAAKGWTFRPAEVKGKPAKSVGVLRLLFSPDAAEMRRQCTRLRPTP